MTYHVGVLPTDLLQALSTQLNNGSITENSYDVSSGLRLVRLPHPRTGVPSLFLPYQLPGEGKSAVMEVQAVMPPNMRSWFLSSEVIEDGKLLVITEIDPAFLLVPLLRAIQPNHGQGNFRPAEDIIEEAANQLASHTKDSEAPLLSSDILHLSTLRCVQAAMRRICEHKEIASDIIVYRYSPDRMQDYLRAKVARLSHQDISELSRTINRSLAKDGLFEDGKDNLLSLGRLRSSCDLVSQYIPRDMYDQLLSSYDFAPLEEHMKTLKEEANALAAMNMNAVESRESRDSKDHKVSPSDKKRKAKGSSVGVEKLKKANTKGMAKLSTFFKKT